jgi:hypothetical protein
VQGGLNNQQGKQMSFAQSIAGSQYQEKSIPLPLGEYGAKFKQALFHTSPEKGPLFIARFTLTRSAPVAPVAPEQHPAGCERSYVQKMSNLAIAGGAVKGFFYAVCGADTDEKKAAVDSALSSIILKVEKGELTGLEGREFNVTVVPHTTRPKADATGKVLPGAQISLMRFSTAV